jgi:outer membrane immunogenic protein
MKRLLIAAALIATAGTSAFAADLSPRMYTKAPPAPALAPAYDWSGWYAGINGGYSWRDPSIDFAPGNSATASFFRVFPPASVGAAAFPTSVNVDPKGALIGGQFGHNWQTGIWVWGLETDLDWADIKSSGTASGTTFQRRDVHYTFTATGAQKLDAFGTLRARVGITPADRVLVYATGGLAYGHAKFDASYGDTACELCLSGSDERWKIGWTVGGGLEWAFLNNWSLKGEYLYYDLGSMNQVLTGSPSEAAVDAHAEFRGNIVRAGLNYKFAP